MKSDYGKQKHNKGVSPFIASVLTILFGVLMLGIVLGVVNPTFKRAQDSSVMSDAFQNLNLLNTAIKEVASEAQDSKRTISISVSGGEYSIDGGTDMIVFKYDPSYDMQMSGTKGIIQIERGSVFMDFFNWYVGGGLAAPVWTNTSGEWTVNNFKYSGNSGLAYHNLTILENYKFSGKIYNSSGTTGGQIFMVPTNPEQLVGFWPFDNRTGNQVYDFTGNDNNGTLIDMNTAGNSTSGWQSSSDCKAGVSCLLFDGVNDYVDVAGAMADMDFNQGTISLWFKIDTNQDNFDRLIDGGGGANSRLYLGFHSNKIWYRIGDQADTNADTTITTGDWHYVVLKWYDSGTKSQIYLDGEVDDTEQTGLSFTSLNANLRIGSTSAANWLNGTVDELKVWNISLTADEIAAEYELSAKKLIASGWQSITNKTSNAAIVLANPYGVTNFDDIKISRTQAEQKLVIPYSKIDLNGTLRIGKGEHKVQIKHMGTNTILSKPIIDVTAT